MYKKGLSGFLKHWDFVLIDMICLSISFWAACLIRQGAGFNPYADNVYISVAIISEAACLAAVIFLDTMKNVLKRGFIQEIKAGIVQALSVILLTSLFLFSVKTSAMFSRIVLYLTDGLYFFSSVFFRCMWKKVLLKKRGFASRKIFIITVNDCAAETVRRLKESRTENYSICGIACADGSASSDIEGVSVFSGEIGSVVDHICRQWVDEVFIALTDGYTVPVKLIDELVTMGIAVHYKIPEISGSSDGKKVVEKIGGYTVITSSIRTVKAEQLFLKRCMDIAGGLVGCLLTAVIFVFLAPAIKLSSPGKVFFVQERIGKNGKKFKMYKFRSMYMDAEERKKDLMDQNRIADGMMFKMDYDPRIIGSRLLPDGTVKKGLGNFIRETSLDEFPQFFNVLKGDMSLVGTRPPTVDEWEKYDLHHRARMAIKPGITGMWQVGGRSSVTDFEEVVRLDTKYISEWSIMLDIKILFKTIMVVFGKKGSM